MCTKNDDEMMYSSLDMVRDRGNCYLSFQAILCSFTLASPPPSSSSSSFFHRIEGISKIKGCFKNGDVTLLMAYFTYDCMYPH